MKHKSIRIFLILISLIFLLFASSCTSSVAPPNPTEVTEATEATEAFSEAIDEAETEAPTSKLKATKPQTTPQKPIEEKPTESNTCSIKIDCTKALSSPLLPSEKLAILPPDGVIYQNSSVTFSEGETVFDILLRVARENNIHLEFSKTPAYNSTYIEGIANLYEFDCGELSGWMYCVNGSYPGYGSSLFKLSPGDSINWVYTCDLGADIGASR